eukprot:3724768-Pyramimonas_sp.AAC.1
MSDPPVADRAPGCRCTCCGAAGIAGCRAGGPWRRPSWRPPRPGGPRTFLASSRSLSGPPPGSAGTPPPLGAVPPPPPSYSRRHPLRLQRTRQEANGGDVEGAMWRERCGGDVEA